MTNISRTKSLVIFLPLIICLHPLKAQQQYSDSLKKHYERKTIYYLQKDSAINEWYTISNDGIKIFASPEDKNLHKPEFELNWEDLETFKTFLKKNSPSNFKEFYGRKQMEKISFEKTTANISKPHDPSQPLKGYRIALDPGHIAGNMEMAKIEKKFVDIKPSPEYEIVANLALIEGNLTLATAKLLKERLQTAGAEVMLTRDLPNVSSLGISFEQWITKDFRKAVDSLFTKKKITTEEKYFLLNKASKREIFLSVFNFIDIKERARKINKFKPDLTIIIHYNVDEKNNDWSRPTDKNFNMAFVGGSFMGEELKETEDRFEFLRLMVSNDLENSISFSGEVIKCFEKQLNVPTATETDAAYLQAYSMKTNVKGVYARNLSLTRLVHGTLIYGESLYQDNIKECRLLTLKELKIDNLNYSKRVQQVAEAYYEGIINYMDKNRE